MIRILLRKLYLTALLLLLAQPVMADDARMQVLVSPDETAGITLPWLQTHIAEAADMALPFVWPRILPDESLSLIPHDVKAIHFLERATPGPNGLLVRFHEGRVRAWLDENHIPYPGGPTYTDVAPVVDPTGSGMAVAPLTATGIQQVPVNNDLLLTVQRPASLAEQILFEQDLRQDPRILDLSLRQVNRDGQQYRVQLQGADDMWLREWFSRRGMNLTATIEGWVASRGLPIR